jgi:hypothetical protein
MAYNRIQASRLLSGPEMDVFRASLSDRLASLTAAQLAAMIRRARVMRDKAKDLLQRQRVATRTRTGSKAGLSGAANERSASKSEAISQALQRFENRLQHVDAANERALRKTAAAERKLEPAKRRSAAPSPVAAARGRASKASTQRPTSGNRDVGPTSESAREARHSMQFKKAGNQQIQAHISSAGRRHQARRDSRG